MRARILGQEDQNAGLAAAASRDVVPLHQGMFPIVGNRMKIQIERFSGQEVGGVDRLVPGAQKASRLAVAQARGILREKALFGKGVQSGKERQTLIGDPGHDMALALQGPKLERQAAAQGMFGGDHF
jgi:hypothetical protein